MKIISWNINSLKARRDHVFQFLKDTAPDVLMVQELKGTDIPEDDFKDAGYHVTAVPQKTYNGVAIFSKTPAEIVLDKLPGDPDDDQARYLECTINGHRLINIYLPNGNPVYADDGTSDYHEKYTYKLSWMDRLYDRLKTLRDESVEFVIGGDFNIIPMDTDTHDPKAWADDALFRLPSRQKFRALLHLGLTDAFRVFNPQNIQYTFWDYQRGARPKNHGIRIDHFLCSPLMMDKATACTVDETPRDWDRPSDHTPIILEIDI